MSDTTCDVAQALVLVAQMEGHGQHGLVGGPGAAGGLGTPAGGTRS